MLFHFNSTECFKESLHWSFSISSNLGFVLKPSKLLKFRMAKIWWLKILDSDCWPFFRQLDLTLFESEDYHEGKTKHKHRYDGNSCNSSVVVSTNNVSIFPNDVGWLSCLSENRWFVHNGSFNEMLMNFSLVVEHSFSGEC